ncbi:MAG: WYL domain-containing protein [Chloroflexi bacterium]|nr:WYL domain-containing protein [Chloroflexota bacterium]MCI0581068.1 WYL domain-containing protein [Chloroflexota bacterium]MCI0649468.1 WYL domain-containing protein [Chloroflexota bacterium]MCI0731861.1 WYL domain-containing protein [Chloroflexota bacterium]
MSTENNTTPKRESPWLVARRCLAILRRVQQGPAKKGELLASVYAAEGEDAYGYATGKALNKKFEADCRRIRENLYVNLRYTPQAGGYTIDALDRPLLDLPDTQLQTLAFLAETFRPETPHALEVQQLIDTLLPWLAPERRRVVERARGLLDVDLRRRDHDDIAPDVWATVQEAYSARQQLQFDYLSSQHDDPLPRQHIVEPWEYYFDTERGHYYLRGYCLFNDGPNGPWHPNTYIYYRLGRILPGTARVLPTRLPPMPRAARRYRVVYELAPAIARLGLSRRPELVGDVTNQEMDGGWVRVEGQTEDLFRLSRNLLYYGANCRVLGGPELAQQIRTLVADLVGIYGLGQEMP